MKTENNLDAIREAYHQQVFKSISDACSFLPTIGLQYDLEWTARQQELYHIDRFNYLHLDAVERGLTPVFITLTLPSEYHQFKAVNGGHIANPKWDGSTVTDGYKKLLKVFRGLYDGYQRRVNGKVVRKTLTYSRVIEPHKDFTPHLHAVVYVEDAEDYKRFFDMRIEKAGLKQVDFERLDKANHSIAYLLKYVSKSIGGKNADIMGWKKVHKIVMVRTSNMPFTKIEYTAFKSNVPFEKKYKNYFMQMREQLLAHRYVALDDARKNKQFFTKEGKIEEFKENFKLVSVGNSVNPKYIITTYSLVTFNDSYVEVEFSDDESNFFSSEALYEYEELAEMPTGNVLYTCEDELYNGVPVPVCDSFWVFEDDNEDYVYHKNKTNVSRTLLSLDFERTFEAPLTFSPSPSYNFDLLDYAYHIA